jgi:hypothetical protein
MFKRLLPFITALAFSASAIATTLNPIQLLAPIAANTVVSNFTGSSASPTAFVMPSCSTSTSALQYTSGTGFTCYANSATTTGTLAQFAATTSTQLAGVISDETGSGVLVFGTSPTIGTPTISGGTINSTSVGATTPNTGAFTTLSATGLVSPSSTVGIKGTATNDNAQAGSIGEFPTPTNLSAVSLTTIVPANVSSVSLTAGDWDIQGTVVYVPAGSTTAIAFISGISTTSATLGANGTFSAQVSTYAAGSGQPSITSPTVRISLASTTTVFLIADANFAVSTCTASGFLRARRVR